jgi:MoxR-like ATPase
MSATMGGQTTAGQALAVAVWVGTPVLLWGGPGTGKSSFVRQLGHSLSQPVETVIASLREPADFAGLPVVADDGSVRLAEPSWARRLADAGSGILFLDEVTTAPPAVQAALLRVVLERTIGDVELGPQVSVIAAANPPEQASG